LKLKALVGLMSGTLMLLLGAAGLPFAVAAARRLLLTPAETARLVPAQGWTLFSFLLLSLGGGLGLLFG
jgi:hypothetical protein